MLFEFDSRWLKRRGALMHSSSRLSEHAGQRPNPEEEGVTLEKRFLDLSIDWKETRWGKRKIVSERAEQPPTIHTRKERISRPPEAHRISQSVKYVMHEWNNQPVNQVGVVRIHPCVTCRQLNSCAFWNARIQRKHRLIRLSPEKLREERSTRVCAAVSAAAMHMTPERRSRGNLRKPLLGGIGCVADTSFSRKGKVSSGDYFDSKSSEDDVFL
eukprot:Gregarina_sp_Pseudo_9__265@NODE_116_length_4176_cov_4_195794_g108_i0_p2_GENE_NODE_116_length_4176_cov_4_195794_g108_i0NODE_116_length_4176_cov_4_195794_g108_i0_p2_ORF_typecomplete_len214_score7_85_NODE_116_length_4176_cov_4_195794_g108_i013501991